MTENDEERQSSGRDCLFVLLIVINYDYGRWLTVTEIVPGEGGMFVPGRLPK